jgi:hypothetical protein
LKINHVSSNFPRTRRAALDRELWKFNVCDRDIALVDLKIDEEFGERRMLFQPDRKRSLVAPQAPVGCPPGPELEHQNPMNFV